MNKCLLRQVSLYINLIIGEILYNTALILGSIRSSYRHTSVVIYDIMIDIFT